jgi:hypothetical protein
MNNLYKGDATKEFYVWIDTSNLVVFNNFKVGSLFSVPVFPDIDNLSFIPNEKAKGFISLFQTNLIWRYRTEYNFEMSRRYYFKNYPSRLEAIYLLPSHKEAIKYRDTHIDHVGDRFLKKVRTVGEYTYSVHDTSWVDFSHRLGMLDHDTIHNVCKSYWNGIYVKDCQLESRGKSWTQKPIIEILYLGRVDFYNKKLSDDK